jgi:outer membrane protein TolC
MRIHSIVLPILLSAIAWLPGCASWYARQAEEDALELLDEEGVAFEKRRRETLVEPESLPTDPEAAEIELPPIEVPEVLRFQDALRIATTRNRDFLTQQEGLQLTALSVLGVRDQFEPRFSSTLAYDLTDSSSADRSQRASADLGISQVLPTGGDLTVTGSTDSTYDDGDEDRRFDFASAVTARLTQPLLRGAGYEVRFESLTQAERDLLYALRDFELFRQDFTIRIINRFLDLVAQRARIENSRQNLDQSRFLLNRSTKFFEVGRGSELDKFRAEEDYLQAEDRLNREIESYALALDRFKVELGLPLETEFDVVLDPPDVKPLSMTLSQAVAAALANRLDLRTDRDQLEDVERRVRIAKQALLPDLDLRASARTSWSPSFSFLNPGDNENVYDLGVTLEIPLERTSERNAYRRALINLDREKRRLSLSEDSIILEVRDALRGLDRIQASLRIQEKSLISAEKRFRIAQIRYREGRVGNRDVVEAQNRLLAARNIIVELKNDYLIERLRLLRTVGTLILDEDGVPIR